MRREPRALPDASDRERGSLHVAAIPMVLALVLLAGFLVLYVASGLSDRRTAMTAADSAALAAARALDESVERHFQEVRDAEPPAPEETVDPEPGGDEGSGDDGADDGTDDGGEEEPPPPPTPAPVWAMVGTSLEDVVDLDAAYEAAEEFAEANGAELVDLRVDLDRWVVHVEVRHEEALVEGETERAHAVASARVRPTGGLCVSDGEIGLQVDGRCRTAVPDSGSALESPEIDGYASRVGLVS